MAAFADLDRRIAAGDWVRLAGPTPSIRAVGKVVEGEYDLADDAMRTARVDVGARELLVSPADLTRVLPDEEARLCEAARDRGLLLEDEPRVQKLLRALDDYRAGRLRFTRTPLLLDLLYALSIHADPDHGSLAIAGLLDDAATVLLAKPSPDEVPPARRAPPGAHEAATFREQRAAEAALRATLNRAREEAARLAAQRDTAERAARCEAVTRAISDRLSAQTSLSAVTPPRSAAQADVLRRVLEGLPYEALESVSDALGLDRSWWGSEKDGRASIRAARPRLEAVLEPLEANALRALCRALGVQGVIPGHAAAIRERILEWTARAGVP